MKPTSAWNWLGFVAVYVLLESSVFAADSFPLRVWKDNTGQHEVNATFLRREGTKVFVKNESGKILSVSMDRLSEDDRKYVHSLVKGSAFVPVAPNSTPDIRAAMRGLVIVAVERGEATFLGVGYVFHRDNQYAYVATHRFSVNRTMVRGALADLAKDKFSIYWEDSKRHKVAAKCIARFDHKQKWVLTAPVEQMPPPLLMTPPTKVSLPTPIRLFGYTIEQRRQPPSYGRITTTAVSTAVFDTLDGSFNRLNFAHTATDHLVDCLAFDDNGKLLGHVTRSQPPREPSTKGTGVVSAFSFLPDLAAPEFTGVRVGAKSGDEKHINYQVVVFIEDPFDKVKAPRLHVRPTDSRTLFRPPTTKPKPLAHAEEIQLAPGEIDEVVKRQLEHLKPGKPYVADVTTPNPGPQSDYRMVVQFSYENTSGERVYLQQSLLAYRPRFRSVFGRPPTAPDVPGFDGRPVDMPKVAKLKDGYLLTSKKTRPRDVLKPEARELPKPQASTAQLGRDPNVLGHFEAIELAVPAQPNGNLSRQRAPMVFSADGNYLYLIDGEYAVRKLRSDNLVEEVSLKMSGQCDDVALSKAGLVVAGNSHNTVSVLDAKTLKVRHEIPVPGVRLVAANPSTNIGFAVANIAGAPIGGPARSQGQAIYMLDLAKARILHILKGRHGTFAVTAGTTRLLFDWTLAARMSPDGKYLFIGARDLQRFRVDGEDLIFEQASPSLYRGHTTHFELSTDGKWTAMPTGGGNSGGNNVFVFDAADLTSNQLDLKNDARPCAIGWDVKTGSIYSATSEKLNVFGPRGKKLQQFPHQLRFPCRLIVNPRGEQFVIWSQGKVVVFNASE